MAGRGQGRARRAVVQSRSSDSSMHKYRYPDIFITDLDTFIQLWPHTYNLGLGVSDRAWYVCTLQPVAPGSMSRFYWQPLWCPVLHYSYGAPRCCGVWGSDVNYSNSTADVLAPHNSTTPPPHQETINSTTTTHITAHQQSRQTLLGTAMQILYIVDIRNIVLQILQILDVTDIVDNNYCRYCRYQILQITVSIQYY